MIYENKLKEQQEKINLVKEYSAEHMPRLPYHNFEHAADVADAAERLTGLEKLSSHQGFLLVTAAYLHDIIYDIHGKDNEERSAALAGDILPKIAYTKREIEPVQGLILATKIPTNPKSRLEEVMCDADVDNLGRADFLEKCELLRQERGVEDRKSWYANTLKFLQGHRYYTASAKALRDEGKQRNLQRLYELVKEV